MAEQLKSQSKVGGGEQSLTVALRIRPMAEDEIVQGAQPAAYKVENNMVVLLDPSDDPDDILRANRSREKQFVFDITFDGSCTQRDVFQATTRDLIPNVTSGYNATVFAYGPTGAGKTYTMLGTDQEPGIMVQALDDLFLEMRQNTDKAFKVTMSYLEIYNEMIRDLLNPDSGYLELREDAKGSHGSVQVAGISEVTARSTEEVMEMLVKGNLERTQEPTAANATSSRSHAILQVTVKQRNKTRNIMQEVRTGRLFLVDLAGSERAANTHNRGKRMIEGAHINRSLLALGNCINALSDKTGGRYINYRDSKLTRLLKDALGGNCKTVMIAHISPSSLQFEESRNTLVYADRAKHIKNKVRRNVTDVAYHIAQYSNIISELRDEIMRLRTKLSDATTQKHSVANIAAVQSEVVESQRRGEDRKSELTQFKEQLLTSFKDQMELRRTLMELTNASMEISLETNRNQLVISEYQVDRSRKPRSGRETTDLHLDVTDNKVLEEKENSHLGHVSGAEPVEVQVARNELKVLHEEKHKTERVKATVQREVDTARAKTSKLEEMIPVRISNSDQQEILSLLCRVHQLEIQSLEGQSAALTRDFTIRHKDMVITKLNHYKNLSDDIITRQRRMIEDNKLVCAPELIQLYELYQEEQHKLVKGDDISSFTSFDKVSSLNNLAMPSTPRLGDVTEEDSNKVFTRSAKAKQIQRAEQMDKYRTNNPTNNNLDVFEDSPTPSAPSRISYTDRKVISTNTRNIAALAAKKRNQFNTSGAEVGTNNKLGSRQLYRPPEDADFDDFGSVLTPSRLAQHNYNMEGGRPDAGLSHLAINDDSADKVSLLTDGSLPPLRTIAGVGSVKIRREEEERRRAVQPARYVATSQPGGYLENKAKKSRSQARKISEQQNQRTRQRRKVTGVTNRPGGKAYNNTVSTAPPASTGDLSTASTPQQRERQKAKVLPTIPQYRKGDIAVTGTATGTSGNNPAKYI